MRLLFLLSAVHLYAAFNLTWGIPAVSLDANPPVGDTDLEAVVAVDPLGNAVAGWGRTAGGNAVRDIWAASYTHASRTWTGAQIISGGSDASGSQVAIDGKGNTIFVWQEGFLRQIYSRTLSLQGVFSPPLAEPPLKVSPSNYPQTCPHIAIDEAGNALAVWLEYYGGKFHIRSAKKAPSQSWLSSIEIAEQGPSVLTRLATHQSGASALVWEHENKVFSLQYKQDAWSAPVQIGEGHSPVAAVDALGRFMYAWVQDGKLRARVHQDGALSSPHIVSNAQYEAKRPAIAADGQGNAIVVFERYDLLHKYVSSASCDLSTLTWSEPLDISPPSPVNAENAGFPVLAINERGDGVAVWKEYDGKTMVIQGAGYSLGSWSYVKTLSEIGSHAGDLMATYDMDVAINEAGQIMAVWPEDPTGDGSQQMKASLGIGLAGVAPQPPLADPITLIDGVAFGSQSMHRYPAHADYINHLQWNIKTPASYYRIYRGNFYTLIGTSKESLFQDHQREPGKKETYLITCVDEHEQESSPLTIVVHPK